MNIKPILTAILLISGVCSSSLYAQNTNSGSSSNIIQDLNISWNIGETVTSSTKNSVSGSIIEVLKIIDEKQDTEVISRNKRKIDSNIAAYPNPTYDKLIIKFDNTSTHSLTVFNLNGRLIKQLEVYQEQITYDFSGYEKGLYMMRIEDKKSKQIKTIKILKK